MGILFSRIQIVAVVVGWFLVISGALMLLKPEWARSRMKRQGVAVARGYLLLALLFVASLAFSLAARAGSGWGWALALAAVVALVWVFVVAMKKISARAAAWSASATVQALRYYAAAQIVIGVLMLMLRGRLIIS